MHNLVMTTDGLWQRLVREWLQPSGTPQGNHLRRDIGLEPLPPVRRISTLVLAWLR